MTDAQNNDVVNGTTPPGQVPELLERGRYAVTGMPDGSWVITRAGPLCERCSECGCGDQGEPVPVPAIAVQAMTGQLNGSARKMLAKMLGRSG